MKKLLVIVSSTGGPKALQRVVPLLPKNIPCPVLIVQHMPAGFTVSLANRLNGLSKLEVKEVEDNDIIEDSKVYIAKGGNQLRITSQGGRHKAVLSDDEGMYGLRPCADITIKSLVNSSYDEIVCVIMTGMGRDGTEGTRTLKSKKKVYTIAQDKESSTVYGMPRVIFEEGLADEVVPLDNITKAITKIMEVH